jgi:anaerobic dimethyl sulfoxide reductase subunit B (iron-sulfur subunit)
MGKQLGFYFDAAACNGCKVCIVACSDKNDTPVGVNFRRVLHYSGGGWSPHPTQAGLMTQDVYAYTVSSACNHCKDPVCLEVCPSGAIFKREEDGLVLIDQDTCLGCRLCETCPYDAPQFNENLGVMTMCDGCHDLLDLGEDPACVAGCPQRALQFGDIDELRAEHGDVKGIEPLPDPAITGPSLVVTPHRHAQPVGEGTGEVRIEPTIVSRR